MGRVHQPGQWKLVREEIEDLCISCKKIRELRESVETKGDRIGGWPISSSMLHSAMECLADQGKKTVEEERHPQIEDSIRRRSLAPELNEPS